MVRTRLSFFQNLVAVPNHTRSIPVSYPNHAQLEGEKWYLLKTLRQYIFQMQQQTEYFSDSIGVCQNTRRTMKFTNLKIEVHTPKTSSHQKGTKETQKYDPRTKTKYCKNGLRNPISVFSFFLRVNGGAC